MSQLTPDASTQTSSTVSDSGSDSSNSVGLNIQRTVPIARNAFREAVRDRVLYNLVIFALLLIAGAIFLGELSAGQEAKIIVDLGFDPLVARIWPAILLIYVELMILTGVALLFSSFSSPALSALRTFFVFVIGHFSAD